MQNWKQANEWESNWWGDCLDTVGEEIKQRTYNRLMGLDILQYDLQKKSVLDIGGGPVSLLLKYTNRDYCLVVDPLKVPEWVKLRYKESGIDFVNVPAERILYLPEKFDECWIYNCLQHVEDPQKIIKLAQDSCNTIRIFEWIDTPITAGHIHTLRRTALNKWLDGEGKVEEINENGCIGTCYYGVFYTPSYKRILKRRAKRK